MSYLESVLDYFHLQMTGMKRGTEIIYSQSIVRKSISFHKSCPLPRHPSPGPALLLHIKLWCCAVPCSTSLLFMMDEAAETPQRCSNVSLLLLYWSEPQR